MMKYARLLLVVMLVGVSGASWASKLLIPMDEAQSNHLKAYGISYWVLSQDLEIDWLLNFRGGSFMMEQLQGVENELIIRGVSYEVISSAQANQILTAISSPSSNMDVMKLQQYPKIAVYSPKSKQPWDDAVTLALTYAEIPYDVIFDDEILNDELSKYDWLHLHHEDFTGQYGKFYRNFHNYSWYQEQVREQESLAAKWGFSKVSHLKLAVARTIQAYVAGGGFLFAMCSATDTFDIALAADGVDICHEVFDYDPADPQAQQKLNYENSLAFENFILVRDHLEYEVSNIDNLPGSRGLREDEDFFRLFQFSAKWDPIPTMLTQNHVEVIKGFMGQTTGFKNRLIKPDVVVMGETASIGEAKYIHGVLGKGFWTFYGGHDPEDYQHTVGEEPTDLNIHPNSPGYRLILNNILFPAAKKKRQKT